MPGYVMIIDLFGLMLAIIGFNMAFRQTAIRRHLGRPLQPLTESIKQNGNEDALTYILRIAGVMMMAFGIAISGMFTLLNLH